MTRSTVGLIGLFFVVISLPVQAQEAPPDTSDVVELGPIVITALRTPFLQSEVPYAVAVNGPEEIQRARPGLGLDEALAGIPGVHVDNRYNYAQGERVSIRGFGARAQFGVRGVKILLDGIPLTLPDGQTALNNIDVGLLQRAEVIRGPASSLYGNASGGVILLQTEMPPASPFNQQLTSIAGQNGLLRLESTTGGQTRQGWYLLNVARLSYEGYRAFNETENLYINARAGHTGANSAWNLVANFVDYDAQNPGALSDSLLNADRTQAYRFNTIQQTGEKGRQFQAGVRWYGNLDIGLLEISGYGIRRVIDNPIPPTIIDLSRLAGGARALFHTEPFGGAAGLRWTVGLEYDVQRDDRQNYVNEQGDRGEQVLDQLENVRNAASFTQVSAEPLARLNLLAGLRYDYFRFSADDRLIAGDNPDDSGSRTMDAVSPSIGVTYEINAANAVYANFSTSFETPTTTELVNRPTGAGGFNPDLEPQRARSVEAGLKGQLFGRTAYQFAAFTAHVDNSLIPYEVIGVPGRQFFRNAGSADHRGVEAGMSWMVSRGILARFSYAYVDARFDEYVLEEQSFAENRVPGISPHRLEAGLTYEGPRGVFADLNGRYVSEMPVNDANTAHSPEYFVVDTRVGIEGIPLGRLNVTAFAGILNLLDERYNTSVVVNAFGGRYFEPGPERAFYIGAQVEFGTSRE